MNALAMIISKLSVLTLLRRKIRIYVLCEGDENTSSNSDFDEDQVNNFVTFTLSLVSSSEAKTDNDFDEGNQNFLVDFEDYLGGRVAFGDGKKGYILGKGTANAPGLPIL
ncbi:hypothetical protein J1N35_005531 [Gossypium stocksii]|uniref:Uncharacterized protein n=1 Tax=Gossypium stocksii TaxID=47602 RepID=A0A9D3WEH0_9ROSI|nr:hypothetical protein J1N35_005531 [Gossypium stocksii]